MRAAFFFLIAVLFSAQLALAQTTVTVTGTIRGPVRNYKTKVIANHKRIVPGGYVMFRNQTYQEFRVTADQKGKYSVELPPGKYYVFAGVDMRCMTCPEYSRQDFTVGKKLKVKLDILLHVIVEG